MPPVRRCMTRHTRVKLDYILLAINLDIDFPKVLVTKIAGLP